MTTRRASTATPPDNAPTCGRRKTIGFKIWRNFAGSLSFPNRKVITLRNKLIDFELFWGRSCTETETKYLLIGDSLGLRPRQSGWNLGYRLNRAWCNFRGVAKTWVHCRNITNKRKTAIKFRGKKILPSMAIKVVRLFECLGRNYTSFWSSQKVIITKVAFFFLYTTKVEWPQI